ncbi:CPBP family intramembrane glutamic endopeptidase [Stakelama saccharophila]|uniref:CPBP family intramembrane glutamic endopeptidase n=1 Tax=Stakelama saccharophila TaxID=3075605 RepID=A0ABZ0BBL1_9SPHN|nr:CPBP family intramembrane glutamic endopeptidase [Stakelama sp. W311]WNO54645.1 CPBP family intramembrane glutamic endopeptidase [Stakelama sp. W311]
MTQAIALGEKRVLQAGKLRWLRSLGWMLTLWLGSILLFGIFAAIGFRIMAAILEQPFSPDIMMRSIQEPGGLAAAFGLALGAVASLAGYALVVRLGEDRRASELALRPAWHELPGGLAVGAGMMAIAVAILGLGGWVDISAQPVTGIWGAIGLSVQSGAWEELAFRLIMFRLLWRAFGPWWALGISAFVFGLVHLSNPNASWFAALCIAVEAGVMLATFYILTGRAWVSVGVHAGWNFTQGWLFGAAVSGTGGFAGGPLLTQAREGAPEWLSGGAFGPEASLAGLIVGCGVGAALLWLAVRRGRLPAPAPRTGQ